MAKSLNRCEFIGNLTKDVETKFMPNGTAVTQFTMACNDGYKDKNSGQQVDQVEYPTIVAFGKLAEIMDKYLKKGSKVYIAGKFKNEKWTDKQGETKYFTKFVASEMLMLDGRASGSGQQSGPTPAASSGDPSGAKQAAPAPNADFDDDIPFN